MNVAERAYRATRIVRTRIKDGNLPISELTISTSTWPVKMSRDKKFVLVPAIIRVPVIEVENFVQEDHF